MRHICKTIGGSNGKLRGIVQPWIEETSFAVHLEIGYKCIPVRDGAPAKPSVQVDPSQSECGWNQRRTGNVRSRNHAIGHLLGIERLPVHEQLGVKFTGTPAVQNLSDSRLVRLQKVRDHAEVGGESHDRTHVQVPVRPAVQTTSDTTCPWIRRNLSGAQFRPGVIYSRVAKCALDSYRFQRSRRIEGSGETDHGI